MDSNRDQELIDTASELFDQNKYTQAESIINQLILKNCKEPKIFQMLGTIYYDQGKFNKAIRAFKRALELDPGFTDASLGLSIILNDLGKYDEGKKVFEEAQVRLKKGGKSTASQINEKFALKHDELGEMYFQHGRFSESLEQFFKALQLSARKAEITMKIVECYVRLKNPIKAIKELQYLLNQYPDFSSARIKLGQLYHLESQSHMARQQWEIVIEKEPNNESARKLLRSLDEGEGLVEL